MLQALLALGAQGLSLESPHNIGVYGLHTMKHLSVVTPCGLVIPSRHEAMHENMREGRRFCSV